MDERERIKQESDSIVKLFASGAVDNLPHEKMLELAKRLEELEALKVQVGTGTSYEDKLSAMAMKMHRALEEFKDSSGMEPEECIARAAPFILDLILIPIVSLSGVKASAIANKFDPVRRKILLQILIEIVRFIGDQEPKGRSAQVPASLELLAKELMGKAETKINQMEEESRGKKEAEFTADEEFQEWLKGWDKNSDN